MNRPDDRALCAVLFVRDLVLLLLIILGGVWALLSYFEPCAGATLCITIITMPGSHRRPSLPACPPAEPPALPLPLPGSRWELADTEPGAILTDAQLEALMHRAAAQRLARPPARRAHLRLVTRAPLPARRSATAWQPTLPQRLLATGAMQLAHAGWRTRLGMAWHAALRSVHGAWQRLQGWHQRRALLAAASARCRRQLGLGRQVAP